MGKGLQDIRAVFNDPNDPSYEFENQCVCFKRVCPKCGTRFPVGSKVCPDCGAPRPRCRHRAMANEVVCRSHARGRPLSIYNILVNTISDGVLEELVEQDDRDLSQEYALAKVALSTVLDGSATPDSKELLAMVKDFFTIAEKKRNIEKGQVLNIAWNDELVNSLRKKIRIIMRAVASALEKNIEDPELRQKILEDIKDSTKMVGNMITVPDKPEFYRQGLPEEASEDSDT